MVLRLHGRMGRAQAPPCIRSGLVKSNRKIIIGAMAGVVLVGVVAVIGLVAMREPEAPAYVTAEVKLGDVEEGVLATGALQPFTVVNVGSQASGEVLSVPVKLGDRV